MKTQNEMTDRIVRPTGRPRTGLWVSERLTYDYQATWGLSPDLPGSRQFVPDRK